MNDEASEGETNVIKMTSDVPGERDTFQSVSEVQEIDGAKFFDLELTDQQLANLVHRGEDQ